MNPKSCGLCFEQILNGAFENLDFEKMQNLLSVLNLDIVDVKQSKEATVCSVCADMSQRLFNFRTACLNTNDPLKSLDHHCAEELILEQTVVKTAESKIKCENGKVCRFCLKYLEENSISEVKMEEDTVVRDMLMKCIPELDANIVRGTCICYDCLESLEKCCSFILRCEDNELVKFLRKKTKQVTVDSNKKTNLIICNAEDDVYNSFMKKEENCIEIEETKLQINYTDKLADEASKESLIETLNERNPVEDKDVKPKPHGGIKEKRFVCDICSYQSNRNRDLKQHYLIHKKPWEVNLFKCDYCSFATKWKKSLTVHTIRHKNPSELPNKEWKQPAKTYTTKISEEFTVKLLFFSDQNLKEVRQHNPVEEKDVKPKPRCTIKQKIFVCNICSNQSNSIAQLKRHYLIHKEPSEVNLFKCDYCPFTTKWKSSLTPHTIRHENPSKLRIFKCNDCPYETSRKQNLGRHVLVHKTLSQVKMYECKVCPFQTKSRIGLQVHERKHQKHHRVKIYSCDKCNYKSKFKHCITKHLQHHKESKQPAKSSQKLKEVRQYKCKECSYAAMRNSNLIQHLKLHKDLSEREIYNCTECSFQALHKTTLRRHYKKDHSNLEVPFGELKIFQCNEGA